MGEYLIWWLSQQECESIGDEPNLPEYIYTQYRSRLGRNARGRLWVPQEIPVENITWADNAIGRWCNTCGGILFHQYDLPVLKLFPGLITNLNMQRIDV